MKNVNFTETPPGICFEYSEYTTFDYLSADIFCFLNLFMFIDYAKHAVHLVVGEGLEAYLPLSDMVDISSEVQRLSKSLSKMQSEYDALLSQLSSPNVSFEDAIRLFA